MTSLPHCQALQLTAEGARSLSQRLANGAEYHRPTACMASLYLDALAASLDRLEAERAGQLSFLQDAFQAELFGPGPSEAREEPNRLGWPRLVRSAPQC